MRLEPHAIAELAGATAARLGADLRDQRQDDDGGDGGLGARASRGLAGPQPCRREHGRRDRLDAARRERAGRRIDGELGLFEVDEFWLDRVDGRAAAARDRCSATCSATSSTATASSRRSPTAGPPSSTRCPPTTQLVLNADDPLIADLGRDRAGVTYFGVEDQSVALAEMQHASDSKHCRRCGAAYVYDAVYLGHLGRYRCPSCGQERPVPDDRGRGDRARRDARGADFTLRTPAGQRARCSCRCRASTTSTTRSAPPRCA